MALLQATTIFFVVLSAAAGLKFNDQNYKPEHNYCPPITPDPNLDLDWLRSIDHWYITKGSERNFFMAIKMAVSESEFESLSLEHVQDSCYLFTGFLESTDIIKLYGLNRKMLEWNYLFRTHRKGIVDFFVHNQFAWTTYLILTDNKTYRLQIDEHKDGTRDFRVLTVGDTVPPEEWERIYKSLEHYGFGEKTVFSLKATCTADPYMKQVIEEIHKPADKE